MKLEPMKKMVHFHLFMLGTNERNDSLLHHGANDNDQFHPTNVWTDENDLFFIHMWLCRIIFWFSFTYANPCFI